MAENQNEKIVYDIEVRVQDAQKALEELKQKLLSTGKIGKGLKFEVNFRITGMEDFRTIPQRLTEVRRALQYLSEIKDKALNFSVKTDKNNTLIEDREFQATIANLRALEKALEDMQKQVNAGNFNKQLQEQKKLQNELEKTIKTYQRMEAAFNRSFTNKTAWSTDKFATQFEKFEDVINRANSLSKQLGLNQTFENPMRAVIDYNDYKKQTQQWQNEQEKRRQKDIEDERKYREELANIKAKQSRQANDTQFIDEQNQRRKTFNNLKQDIIDRNNASVTEAKQQEKINTAVQQYMNIYDQLNTKKRLGVQLSELEYENAQKQLKNAKERVRYNGGDVSQLPTLGTRKTFNNEAQDNYIKNLNSRMIEALQMSTSYHQQMNKLSQVLDTATYAWNKSGRTIQEYRNIMLQAKTAIDQTSKSLIKLKQATGNAETVTDKMMRGLRTHLTWIASSVVASIPLVLPGYAISTMKNLESRFATVEQVMPEIEEAHGQSLNKNLSEMERMAGLKKVNDEMNTFIGIGKRFGVAVEDVIEAGASIGRMYGQGENGVTNTNLLTQQAARIAVADNFPIIQATKGLESALSQFGLQTENTNQLMINSNRIIDVWTTAAHKGAASAQDLTEGVQLAGAAAHQAGVSFEFLNALISTGVRSTGRTGNEIGNSIKSFLNSMQSDKSIKALQEFGINMFQDNGDGTQSLRSMEDVILDISRMMQTTNKDTSGLLLTLSGGKYQVSKLTAILKDYKELVRMTGILNSSDVTGFTDKQIEIQLNTWMRKLESLKTNIQGLFMDVGSNGGLDALKSVTDYINNIVVGIRELDAEWSEWIKGITIAVAALKGIPFVIENVAKMAGRINQAWQNTSSQTLGSMSSGIENRIYNYWSDNYRKGQTSQMSTSTIAGSKQAETQAVREETQVENENTQAKITNAQASSTIVTTSQKETSARNNVVVATNKQSNAMSQAEKAARAMGLSGQVVVNTTRNIGAASKVATAGIEGLTVATRAANAVMSGFGGPIGLAITALSILIPILLSYTESAGEAANASKELRQEQEEQATANQETYNRQVRAAQSAKTLAENYNQLQVSLANCIEGSEEYNKIEEDLQVTKTAMIRLIGEENVAVDENGNIKIDTINAVEEEAKKAFKDEVQRRVEIVNNAAWEAGEKVRLAKEKIKAMEEEAKGIGILSKAYAAFAKVREGVDSGLSTYYGSQVWLLRKLGFDDRANQFQELADMHSRGAQYWNEQSSVEETSEFQDAVTRLHDLEAEYNKQLIELDEAKIKAAQVLTDTDYSGGANSDRGNYIAEPPEEKEAKSKKGKSKAEREAEKLAKQQEDYNKFFNRIALVGEQTALNGALQKSSFTGMTSGGGGIPTGVENPEAFQAAAMVAEMVNRPDLAKIIYAQWAHESGRFKQPSGRNNFAGLKGTNGDYRYFGNIMEFAQKYFEDYLRYYDLTNVWTATDFAHVLKQNGYYTGNESVYAHDMEGIVSEIGNIPAQSVSSNIQSAGQWADQMAAIGKYYGDTGCTAFVQAFLEQAGNSFADEMSLNVPNLMEQAKQAGTFKNQQSGFNAGDIVIVDTDGTLNEPDHVVIADGNGGYWGNSNSNQRVVHSNNLNDFKYIWGVVSTGSSGSGNYVPSMSASSLATPSRWVYNILKSYGVDMEKLNALSSATTIPSMIAATDRAGMNVTYEQKIPIAGDILYDKQGNAYLVRNNGGYISSNNKTGDNWKDIKNLTYTYTAAQYATGVTLENAGQKLGGLRLTEVAENLENYRINRDQNDLEMFFQNRQQGTQSYEYKQQQIANRRSLYGQYDYQAAIDEYDNEVQDYITQKLNKGIIESNLKKRADEIERYFSGGALKGILNNSGYDDWKELSDSQLGEIANKYSQAINDDSLSKLIASWKQLKDASTEATKSMESAYATVQKLNGARSPEEQLEWNLNRMKLRTSEWTSNYASLHGGSYDGIDWQSNKRNHQDAIRQVQLYSDTIKDIETQLDEMIKNHAAQSYIDSLTDKLIEMRTKLHEAEKEVDETGDRLTKKSKETLSSMLYDVIKGGNSFKDLWTEIWNQVAEVALKRLMGIKDATNDMWEFISNIFGFGGKTELSIGENNEAGRMVDNINATNNVSIAKTAYNPMSTAERVGYNYSAQGVADFYGANNNPQLISDQALKQVQQSAATNLQAAQVGQQASAVNQTVSTVEQAVSATDQANATTDATTATTTTAAATTMSLAAADMLSAATMMSTSSFGGFGNLPFAKGGSLMGFAKGGRMISGGGKIKGAGTGTSDSILAYLKDKNRFIGVSDGEYIMNANATRKYEGILQMMNMDKFADGGSLSTAPVPYVPTLKNPNIVNKIAQQDAYKKNQNATMEKLLGQQNGILQGIANNNGDNGNNGQVVILNTRASKEEIFSALASDPRALQKLLGNNRNRGFR